MKPPESTGGRVAASLGILAAGAAVGAGAGYVAMPGGNLGGGTPKKSLGAVVGAMGGVALASLGALGLTEFLPSEWEDVERMTALLGGGALATLVGWGAVKEFSAVAGASSGGTPALPGAPTSTNFSVSIADSGRTLRLGAGDTITLTLPAPSGEQWSVAAPAGLLSLQSPPSVTGDVQTFVLVAGAGSGTLQATPSGGGGAFSLKVNVV
jgi:hypothetical protein